MLRSWNVVLFRFTGLVLFRLRCRNSKGLNLRNFKSSRGFSFFREALRINLECGPEKTKMQLGENT